MSDLSNTQFFQVEPGPQISAKDILEIVFKALKEKGYNPVNQIVGYIMSGDPTYITSYNGARSLVMKVERDELVEELLKAYIERDASQTGKNLVYYFGMWNFSAGGKIPPQQHREYGARRQKPPGGWRISHG